MFDYGVADRLGQPANDAFYDSFYEEQPENFVYFDKHIYPKNISPNQAIELEGKLDDLAYKSNKIFDEHLPYGEPFAVMSAKTQKIFEN